MLQPHLLALPQEEAATALPSMLPFVRGIPMTTGKIYRPEGCLEIKGMHGFKTDWSGIRIIDEDQIEFRFEPGRLKKDFELHGYIYPSPLVLKRKLELGEAQSLSLREVYKPGALLTLTRNLAIEATKRGVDISTEHVFDEAYQEFHRKKHVTLTLLSSYKYDLDRDLEEDYLYTWLEVGGYHGESKVRVGLVLSHLLVCLATKEITLVWWERETSVMGQEQLEKWFQEIVAEFNQTYHDMNEAILNYMKKAQDICDQVEREVKDLTIHLYQEPGMETFWIERGDIRTARKLIAANRNPNSHKDLLPTLDAQAVEDAIVKQVIWHITNAEQIMANQRFMGPVGKLTPVSGLLVIRWGRSEFEGNDQEEQQILLNLANGHLRERLREALQQMDPASKDYQSVADYLGRQLDSDMDSFLKHRGMDISLKPGDACAQTPNEQSAS